MATKRTCRTCRNYEARSRWCSGAEEYVRRPQAGGCSYYDGPEPEGEDLGFEPDRADPIDTTEEAEGLR